LLLSVNSFPNQWFFSYSLNLVDPTVNLLKFITTVLPYSNTINRNTWLLAYFNTQIVYCVEIAAYLELHFLKDIEFNAIIHYIYLSPVDNDWTFRWFALFKVENLSTNESEISKLLFISCHFCKSLLTPFDSKIILTDVNYLWQISL